MHRVDLYSYMTKIGKIHRSTHMAGALHIVQYSTCLTMYKPFVTIDSDSSGATLATRSTPSYSSLYAGDLLRLCRIVLGLLLHAVALFRRAVEMTVRR